MKTSDMSEIAFGREMDMLLFQVEHWAKRLNGIQKDIKLEPTKTGRQRFPLAEKLKDCWDYAAGKAPKPETMHETLEELMALLWCPVADSQYNIPAHWWRTTPLGRMIKMCLAREKIDNGEEVTGDELTYLANMTPQRIRQMCADGVIKARKISRKKTTQEEWSISATEAAKVFNRTYDRKKRTVKKPEGE